MAGFLSSHLYGFTVNTRLQGMGCGGSKEEVDLATANGGMTGPSLGPITTGQSGFVLKQKMWGGGAEHEFGGSINYKPSDYDIKDHNGNTAYKVLATDKMRTAMLDMLHVTDAAGTKVAVLAKKRMASSP